MDWCADFDAPTSAAATGSTTAANSRDEAEINSTVCCCQSAFRERCLVGNCPACVRRIVCVNVISTHQSGVYAASVVVHLTCTKLLRAGGHQNRCADT